MYLADVALAQAPKMALESSLEAELLALAEPEEELAG
jgi:hypothetical protein